MAKHRPVTASILLWCQLSDNRLRKKGEPRKGAAPSLTKGNREKWGFRIRDSSLRSRMTQHKKSDPSRLVPFPWCRPNAGSFALLTPVVGTSVEILRCAQDDTKRRLRSKIGAGILRFA